MNAATCAAKRYLDGGAPFKGDSDFAHKNLVRETGASFFRNPLKVHGARDGQPSGWWVAKDERTLLALLSLPADTTTQQAVWRPLHLDPAAVGALRNEIADRIALEEAAYRAARVAQPKAQSFKQDRQWLGIEDDTDSQIMVLAERLELLMDQVPPIVEASTRWDFLGPRSGMTDAERLLRGLNMKLITPKRARDGNAPPAQTRKRTRGGALDPESEQMPDQLAAQAARDAVRRASAATAGVEAGRGSSPRPR